MMGDTSSWFLFKPSSVSTMIPQREPQLWAQNPFSILLVFFIFEWKKPQKKQGEAIKSKQDPISYCFFQLALSLFCQKSQWPIVKLTPLTEQIVMSRKIPFKLFWMKAYLHHGCAVLFSQNLNTSSVYVVGVYPSIKIRCQKSDLCHASMKFPNLLLIKIDYYDSQKSKNLKRSMRKNQHRWFLISTTPKTFDFPSFFIHIHQKCAHFCAIFLNLHWSQKENKQLTVDRSSQLTKKATL